MYLDGTVSPKTALYLPQYPRRGSCLPKTSEQICATRQARGVLAAVEPFTTSAPSRVAAGRRLAVAALHRAPVLANALDGWRSGQEVPRSGPAQGAGRCRLSD